MTATYPERGREGATGPPPSDRAETPSDYSLGVSPASTSSAGVSGTVTAIVRLVALDVQLRQPLEPARQVPVAVAEQPHRRRHEERPHDRGVHEHRHRQAEAHLLQRAQAVRTRSPVNTTTMMMAAPVMMPAVVRRP